MTLRGRLTTAFLAVVLGPILLGAVFVGGTVSAVGRRQSVERLNLAATVVRTSVNALCQQLHAAADAVAVIGDPAGQAGTASQVIARGIAAAVLVTDASGIAVFLTSSAPPRPWTDCAGRAAPDSPVRALAAVVELRDPTGIVIGAVWAAQVLDGTFVARLAAATGTEVSLLPGAAEPGAAARSTEPTRTREGVLTAARRTVGDQIARTDGGRYVRRVGPSPGQPLPLVLSVPREPPNALYILLLVAVLFAALIAVLVAWRLARSTTRPLAELARAADRVAAGDLAARVPVRAPDEVGQLASTFNRMTRETQSYVHALTTSRDQLRGHLAVLGNTLASTHDLQRILRVILQTARVATGARAGIVLLIDPGTGMLVGQCAEGLAGHWPRTGPGTEGSAAGPGGGLAGDPTLLRLPLGEGLLGTVAATGEPMRGRTDRDGATFSPDEPCCRTYMAVPFSTADPAGEAGTAENGAGPTGSAAALPIGVLALYDRLGSDEFDDTDLVTLRAFAGDAAVAVENVRVHEEAQRLSLTDPLTGLWNYRYLKESIRREIERASRFGRMLGVLALDLDRFKEVNDTYGHAAGDAVLAEFARRVRGALREVDLAFRQGGEEFVVLLPETDARGAATAAERLGAAIRDIPIVVEPPPGAAVAGQMLIPVSVSIGIAVYPDHASTGPQALDAADDALYAAKAAGRDTYRMAVAGRRPVIEEMAVPAGATTPPDGLPWAGGQPDGGLPWADRGQDSGFGGALSGPQPPQRGHGR